MERKDQSDRDGISSQAGLSSLSGGQARSLPSVPQPGQPGSRFNPVVVSREEQAARRAKAAAGKSPDAAPQVSGGSKKLPLGPNPAAGSRGGPGLRGTESADPAALGVSGGSRTLSTGPNPAVGPGVNRIAGAAAPAVAQGLKGAEAEDAGIVGAAAQGFSGGFMAGMEGLMAPAAAAVKPQAPKGAVRSPEHIAALENIDGNAAEQEREAGH